MIKSSTPVWVLIFSFLFGFEKLKLNLIIIISVIVLGICLTIDGEPKFDTKGFFLVSISAIASGLRWNMTQLLMKKKSNNTATNNNNSSSPLSAMYHLSPVMFITMLLLSLYFENPFHQQISSSKSIMTLLVMSFGGVLGNIIVDNTILYVYLTQ